MSNELALLISLILIYSSVIIWYYLFDIQGLYCFTIIATICANVEVLILIKAFNMDQTLGNILFASTFLITDIISEIKGKEKANMAVNIGILTSITFILISQSWFLYTPSSDDTMFSSIHTVFDNTPRMMIVGLLVYAIVQRFDVWAYHKWWQYTIKKTNNKDKLLFIRNNASTLISQLLNTILFTFLAFVGTYDLNTLITIALSSYIIFVFTSLLDTPFIYLARFISSKRNIKNN